MAHVLLVVGHQDEGELVTLGNGVNVGLQEQGVVVVLTLDELDGVLSGSALETTLGVGQIDPAALDDLALRLVLDELDNVNLVHVGAHEVVTGLNGLDSHLTPTVAGGIVGVIGLVRDVDQESGDRHVVGLGGDDLAGASLAVGLVVGEGGLEVNLDGALDGDIVLEGRGHEGGVDGTGLGGDGLVEATPGGRPPGGGQASSLVVGVDGDGVLSGLALDLEVASSLVGVVGGPLVAIEVALGHDLGEVLGTVVDAIQVVGEPLVQDVVVALVANHDGVPVVIVRRHVSALVQHELNVLAGLLEAVVHHLVVLRGDVLVVKAVNDEGGALEVVVALGVVTVGPHLRVVGTALDGVGLELVEVVAVVLDDAVPVILVDVTTGAHDGKAAQLIAGVVRGPETLAVVVVVPAGNTRDGNDGVEALDASLSQAEVGGSTVGTTSHADVTVGPAVGDDRGALTVGEGLTITVQPLDDALEGVNLDVRTAGLETVGATGAEAGSRNDCVATGEVVVVPVQRLVVHEVIARGGLVGADVPPLGGLGVGRVLHGGGPVGRLVGLACSVELAHVKLVGALEIAGLVHVGAARDVGTSLVDGGSLVVATGGGERQLDDGLDHVLVAVTIGVVVGLDPDAVANGLGVGVGVLVLVHVTRGEGEDGLGLAVEEQRLLHGSVSGGLELADVVLGLDDEVAGGSRAKVGVVVDQAHADGEATVVLGGVVGQVLGKVDAADDQIECVGDAGLRGLVAVGDVKTKGDLDVGDANGLVVGLNRGGRDLVGLDILLDGRRGIGECLDRNSRESDAQAQHDAKRKPHPLDELLAHSIPPKNRLTRWTEANEVSNSSCMQADVSSTDVLNEIPPALHKRSKNGR